MRPFALVVLAALVAASAACGSVTPRPTPTIIVRTTPPAQAAPFAVEYDIANLAITLFHVRYDQRNWSGVYAMTDPLFRGVMSEAQLAAALAEQRERLGMSGPGVELSLEIDDRARAPDVQVTIVQETAFEKGLRAERFVWRVTRSGTATLVSYEVR